MLWDQIFGTYYYKEDSEVDAIGIQEKMPATFAKQLLVPFIWNRYQDSGEDADTR